jgi:hypothetical protein
VLPLTWLAAKDVFECADPMGSIQEERSPDLVGSGVGIERSTVRLSALRSERQPLTQSERPSGQD